jgi:hypothetical protein
MSDTQLKLREPEQVNWDSYNTSGSNYQAPPDAVGVDGKPIVYEGVVQGFSEKENQFAVDAEGNSYLNLQLDPIVIAGPVAEGYTIRFTEASVKPFEKNGKPIAGNPNKLANVLRSAGAQARPQTNDQYKASVKQLVDTKRKIRFTVDWEARNKETGEKISGYTNFPPDPANPGKRLAVLKKGQPYTVTLKDGSTEDRIVQANVLFANAKVKWFQDPNRGGK